METGPRAILPEEKKRLLQTFADDVVFDEPMSAHTSLGIGGPADVFVAVRDKAGLADIISWTREIGLPYHVLGRGTNLLVGDAGIRGIVILLKGDFCEIRKKKTADGHVMISAGAGAGLGALCEFAISEGLCGLNFAVGIPGTVGGAILMNAGAHAGSISNCISAIRIMTHEAKQVCLADHQISWSYRKMESGLPESKGRPSVVYKGLFAVSTGDNEKLRREANEFLAQRKKNQPIGVKSAGSFFKNPPGSMSAGELIERAGLKGVSVGKAQVSSAHANFIINTKDASADDVFELMEMVQKKVLKAFGVKLEPEVKIAGV